MFFKALTVAAALGSVVAQRPSNTSICDYYTTALLKNNTAANQKTLLTLVVNTAVIGNYTMPNVGIAVPGILAPGAFNGTAVNLAPYFDGGFASSNRGGSSGVSINFLDGGGAAPLKLNMPANSTTSNQYLLLTHLYEFFGALLGCSMEGTADYAAYSGEASMYQTHRFMDLSLAEVSYFIEQVGLSAASFGVAAADVNIVGNALASTFGYRCAPAVAIIAAQGAQLPSICTDASCPLAVNSTCSSYNTTAKPSIAIPALVPNSTGSSTGSGSSATGSTPATPSKAGSATVGLSIAAVAAGVAAMLL